MGPTVQLPSGYEAAWSTFEELSARDVHDLLRLRQQIFILEQTSLYADIDGKDPHALHFLIRQNDAGEVVGAIRLFTDAGVGEARIGRVVIAKSARGSGMGRFLMVSGIVKARDLVPGCRILLSAQQYLEEFYVSLGFRTVSPVYIEDGIPHIDMILPASNSD
ncbi:GNAT family N-acetyltransferase [Rhodobacterales bacterium]|nr:GNAT family N-acetyltransferase [Rhodobacterales bacterium]